MIFTMREKGAFNVRNDLCIIFELSNGDSVKNQWKGMLSENQFTPDRWNKQRKEAEMPMTPDDRDQSDDQRRANRTSAALFLPPSYGPAICERVPTQLTVKRDCPSV
jgi:hypothetical protein